MLALHCAPTQCVSHHLVVSDLPSSSVIVVEEDDRAPDPVDIVLNTPHIEPGQSNCEEKSDILRIGMNI